jgi:putative ABC transport system substrate-binding protein
MTRRDFIVLLAGTAASPCVARAQQKAIPVVGFLRSTTAAPFTNLAEAFRDGLKETGFIEGANVSIQYRYANGRRDRLPELAAELLRDGAAVIAGNSLAAEATKGLTATVPIVFVTSDDPVERGLVASLARPGGNATGFTFFGGGQLAAKRVEILHELTPSTAVIGFLVDPNFPGSRPDLADSKAAAVALGLRLVVAEASGRAEFAHAFTTILEAGAGALIVAGSPSFSSQRSTLIELSARHALPTIYDLRRFVDEGGLASYSGSFTDAYRQAGIYAGRILKGARPADLPVQQPSKIDLVINLKTAKALGLTVPPLLLVEADEVIE